MSIDPFAYPAEYEPADRIFTRPSHNESAARAEQARNLLDSAQNADHRPSFSHDAKQFNYADGVEALRDALAGQGQATLAVHAELGRIAAALEMIAKTPAALEQLAERVAELGNDVCEVHTAIEESGQNTAAAIREHAETVNDALGNVAETIDRVRWWQLRRRWFNRRQRTAAVQEIPAEVYKFRVDLRGAAQSSDAPLASIKFTSVYDDAYGIALKMLPGLCAEAEVPAHPDHVYGRIFRSDRDGEFHHVDSVFLPDAAVAPNPPTLT